MPGPNVVNLSFPTPFLYDPSSGNDFLCEVTFPANSWTGGGTTACDAFTTGSMASRIYNTTDPAALTGTVGQNHALALELIYVPASGLYPNFTATPQAGSAPLNVQFTDTSFTSDPLGIQQWAWDFNNDSIIDSIQQNPVYTFPAPGSYNVSLAVADAFSTDSIIVNVGVSVLPLPGFGNTFSSATLTRGFYFQAPTRFITQTNIVTTGGNAPYSSETVAALARVDLGLSNSVGISYGAGTPSGGGPIAPRLFTTGLPRMGTTAELTVTQQDPSAFGYLLLSLGRGNLPLPFGTLLVDLFTYQMSLQMNNGIQMNVGDTTYQIAIPNDPSLNGAGPVTWQNLNLVPGSPNQVSLSNGHEWFAGL